MQKSPSLSQTRASQLDLTVRATHGVKRKTGKGQHLTMGRRPTLERARLPDDQWVPSKDSILVNPQFFREEGHKKDESLDSFSISSAQRLRDTLQEIDAESTATNRWSRGDWLNALILATFCSLGDLTLDSSSQALAAEAGSAAPSTIGGLNATEAGILVVPVALYAAFTIYRKSNPRADVGNFLLGIMAVGIFSNILFIGLFKIRLF